MAIHFPFLFPHIYVPALSAAQNIHNYKVFFTSTLFSAILSLLLLAFFNSRQQHLHLMAIFPITQLLKSLLPAPIQQNIDVATFFALLSYILFLINWLVTTDWIEKLHLFSGALCAVGVFYLHYSEVAFLAAYEAPFVVLWLTLLYYHVSTWRNNYARVKNELDSSTAVAASMRPFKGSIFRYFIVMPVTKNASNQWNPPPFKNTVHVILMAGYLFLLGLHVIPFFTPMHCLAESGDGMSILQHLSQMVMPSTSVQDPSFLCCRYNYAMTGFDLDLVQGNYCSGRVRVAFAGSWSTVSKAVIADTTLFVFCSSIIICSCSVVFRARHI